jgi:hypothetical protein
MYLSSDKHSQASNDRDIVRIPATASINSLQPSPKSTTITFISIIINHSSTTDQQTNFKMQLTISLFTTIAAFVATANAVGICTGVNSDGTCTLGTCTIHDISVGQTLNVPGTQCIFNTDVDTYVQSSPPGIMSKLLD